MKVSLRTDPLSVDAVTQAVSHPGAGAVVIFLGAVRDENEGHPVTRLEYTAYESMALAEMARIVEGLENEMPGVRLAVAHRTGMLLVGDLAVVCAASAKHRPDAFQASRALIDRIKARVPIWKREYGPEGPAWVGWVDARCTHPDPGGGPEPHAHARPRDEAGKPSHHGPEDTPATRRGVRVVTITVSDTRTEENDVSGRILAEELSDFTLVRHERVPDEPGVVRALVLGLASFQDADAVVLTGGTGIAPRDRTCEALEELFDKTLDGFGEAFRRLSWDEIGARATLSRATAGTVKGMLVFALPGSTAAARLGARALIAPVLAHATALARQGKAQR